MDPSVTEPSPLSFFGRPRSIVSFSFAESAFQEKAFLHSSKAKFLGPVITALPTRGGVVLAKYLTRGLQKRGANVGDLYPVRRLDRFA